MEAGPPELRFALRPCGHLCEVMPIFQVAQRELKQVAETTFGAEGILERQDLQNMLREQIGVLDDRLMVVAEEFGDWVDSSRRIDLLCLDTDANLVVVELKRTELAPRI